jgi:hypothetical protein
VNEAEKRNAAAMQALAIRTAIEYQDRVAPELLDTITGSDPESIRKSAERAEATSQRIVQRVLSELHRPSDVDPAWQANQAEGYGDQQPLSAEQIAGMSMQEYARHRSSLTGQQDVISFLGGSR